MKKVYETPEVEKIAFQYRDQVVAASGCIVSGSYSHETSNNDCYYDPNDAKYTNK